MSKIFWNLSFVVFFAQFVQGQDCTILLEGYVKDATTGYPLEHASIFIDEIQGGTISDSTGYFSINGLCVSHLHIEVSHIGCESQRIHIDLVTDTVLHIQIDHFNHELHDITIVGTDSRSKVQQESKINIQEINQNASKGIADILESISGVSTLKNGAGISKPVIHGLYGNRISILNNGISQAGQQWGNDHSPEIDPLIVNDIRVIKGVGSLEVQGSNLGSSVMVSPRRITRDPHIHGKASYFMASNGNLHGTNLQLEQFKNSFGWKINGTLKKAGDRKTPDYFLTNTGNEEANFAIQLEKSSNEGKWNSDLFLSTYNTTIGILRGSHISNLTDLQSALNQDVPFFTSDEFSYSIDAPKQVVHHHLAKLHSKYFTSDHKWFDFTLGGQVNQRAEFDVRRSGRSDIAALDLNQVNLFAEGKYKVEEQESINSNIGFQLNFTNNKNNPATGILPLIPDYRSYESGLFTIFNERVNKLELEGGFRYDFVYQNVATISTSLPREIIRYENNFHNINVALGAGLDLGTSSLSYNIGYVTRNPAINELYSNGLHQGVSGIEEGDLILYSEKSLKTTISLKSEVKEKLFLESSIYFQHVNDFIYLAPQDELRLTIRGAFPVFRYEQTTAKIYGLDLEADYHISEPLSINIAYSFIHGSDTKNSLPLINIPANNAKAALSLNIPKWSSFENLEFSISNQYVFRQNRLESEQDFVPTPDAYNLINLKVASDLKLQNKQFHFYLRIENLFNVSYRDYLNRQRYFADDLGRNLNAGLSLSF